jgi:hypothetical protein
MVLISVAQTSSQYRFSPNDSEVRLQGGGRGGTRQIFAPFCCDPLTRFLKCHRVHEVRLYPSDALLFHHHLLHSQTSPHFCNDLTLELQTSAPSTDQHSEMDRLGLKRHADPHLPEGRSVRPRTPNPTHHQVRSSAQPSASPLSRSPQEGEVGYMPFPELENKGNSRNAPTGSSQTPQGKDHYLPFPEIEVSTNPIMIPIAPSRNIQPLPSHDEMAWLDPFLPVAGETSASLVPLTNQPYLPNNYAWDAGHQIDPVGGAACVQLYGNPAASYDLPHRMPADTFEATSSRHWGTGKIPATSNESQYQYPPSILPTVSDSQWVPRTEQMAVSDASRQMAVPSSQSALGLPLDDGFSLLPVEYQSHTQVPMNTGIVVSGSQPNHAPRPSLGQGSSFRSVNGQLTHRNQGIDPCRKSGSRPFLTPRAFPDDPSKIPYIRGAVSGVALSLQGTELSMLHVQAEGGKRGNAIEELARCNASERCVNDLMTERSGAIMELINNSQRWATIQGQPAFQNKEIGSSKPHGVANPEMDPLCIASTALSAELIPCYPIFDANTFRQLREGTLPSKFGKRQFPTGLRDAVDSDMKRFWSISKSHGIDPQFWTFGQPIETSSSIEEISHDHFTQTGMGRTSDMALAYPDDNFSRDTRQPVFNTLNPMLQVQQTYGSHAPMTRSNQLAAPSTFHGDDIPSDHGGLLNLHTANTSLGFPRGVQIAPWTNHEYTPTSATVSITQPQRQIRDAANAYVGLAGDMETGWPNTSRSEQRGTLSASIPHEPSRGRPKREQKYTQTNAPELYDDTVRITRLIRETNQPSKPLKGRAQASHPQDHQSVLPENRLSVRKVPLSSQPSTLPPEQDTLQGLTEPTMVRSIIASRTHRSDPKKIPSVTGADPLLVIGLFDHKVSIACVHPCVPMGTLKAARKLDFVNNAEQDVSELLGNLPGGSVDELLRKCWPRAILEPKRGSAFLTLFREAKAEDTYSAFSSEKKAATIFSAALASIVHCSCRLIDDPEEWENLLGGELKPFKASTRYPSCAYPASNEQVKELWKTPLGYDGRSAQPCSFGKKVLE